jgi:hypothetical protein
MTFLNPLYLFGLAAAGIPIVIHLLTRKRPKRIEFSSIEFLREVNVAQLRRFRLRELILLALRVLAIALLSLALARPAVRGAVGPGGREAASSVVMLIDRSASMGAVEAREVLSERAQAKASSVLEALEAGDEVQVVPFDARPEPLFPKATVDHGRVANALRSIEPRPFTTDLEAAIGQGLELLRKSPQINRELFLISDLQVAGLPSGGTRASSDSVAGGGPLPAGLHFYVLPVAQVERPENLALTAARVRSTGRTSGALSLGGATTGYALASYTPAQDASAQYAPAQADVLGGSGGGQAAAEVTVQAFGGASGEIAVGVRASGRELGRAFVALGSGEGSTLVPLASMPDGGGEAFLPEDALEIDNHRWFAAGPAGRTQVGLIEGGSLAASPMVLALLAGQEAGQVEFRRLEGATLSPGSLAGLDALVLNDVPTLGEAAMTAIVDYVRGGGALAVVLGERARPEFYGARLFPALSGIRLGDQRDAGGGQWTMRLAAVGHPAFDGFSTRTGEPLTQATFKRAWTLRPGPATRVLARFATDLPALVEESRLLVFASDVDGKWNDFPTRGAFLPLWLQSLRAIARGASGEDLRPGQRLSVPVPVGERAPDLRLTDPAGKVVALEQSLSDGARRLVSAPLVETGLYRLSAGTRRLREVAVNLDPRESDLTRMSPEAARRRWAAYKPVVLDGGGDLARRIREGRFGREIGGSLLWLALLCLVLETAIARLMTPGGGMSPRNPIPPGARA